MRPQYRAAIKAVKALVKKWEPLLDLPGTEVIHKFHDTKLDPSNADDTAAVTTANWPYRYAVIDWYLPNLCNQKPSQLEELVVHEYCHVLNASLEAAVAAERGDVNEIAAQNVTRALLRVAKK